MPRRMLYLLCSASLSLFPVFLSAQAPSASFDLDARLVLNAYQAAVEAQLGGVLNGLKALAATQEATSGDWDRINRPLAELGARTPANAAAWLTRPDGTYFTVERGRVDQNLKDRSYFSTLMNGRDVIGTLVVSKSTGERSIIIATPIMGEKGIIGALGMSLSAARLAKMLTDEIHFPDNVVFYALDSRGLTVLHKDTSLIFQFPSDIGDESLKSAVQTMLSEPEGLVRYRFRDADRVVIFHRSEATGWIFALGSLSS